MDKAEDTASLTLGSDAAALQLTAAAPGTWGVRLGYPPNSPEQLQLMAGSPSAPSPITAPEPATARDPADCVRTGKVA